MKDYSVIIILIIFCFLFYLSCLFSLQQQVRLRDSDIRKIIYESCQYSKRIVEQYENDINYKRDIYDKFTDGSPPSYELDYINQDGSAYTGSRNKQSKDEYDYRTNIEALFKEEQGRNARKKSVRCPTNPAGLRNTSDLLERKQFEPVKYGGSYKPKHCISTERVAIIVPYRDRKNHLEIFLRHMHDLLQKQQLEYTIFVVEMALPTQFNRGLLANVGFITAESSKKFTCFIFHDVDLLPINETNLYRCSDNPRHMSVKNSKYQFKLPYSTYFGGVVAFRKNHFIKINGFSNMYFGWGAEDDDLKQRLKARDMIIDRLDREKCYYQALPHVQDTSNPNNPTGRILLDNAVERMGMDGINSVKYFRQALEFRELYTWIYVVANETEIMGNYTHLRPPPWSVLRTDRVDFRRIKVKHPWLNSIF